MTDVFDRVFAAVLGVEGGFTNNPLDPGNWTGGRAKVGVLKGTKFGISAAAYPALDIVNLILDDAKAIYRRDYWDKVSGDDLPPPVALITFDGAVNSGVDRSAKWLQAALGVGQDGNVGPTTIAAARQKAASLIAAEIASRRIVFLAGLPTWPTFGLGWARRVNGVLGTALTMDHPTTPQTITISPLSDEEMIKRAMRAVLDERKAA